MRETAALRRRILSRRATVAVVGQTHAGLSLACAAAHDGFRVAAIDTDEARISDLNRGVLSVPGVSEHAFRAGLAGGRLTFSTRLESIQEHDLVVVCAQVPIRDQTPDVGYVESLCRQLGRRLRPGHLVIMESAGYPGMTDEVVRPAVEASGLSATNDFLLAYSPERVDPGNEEHGIQNTPRIVGGTTREATGVAALFYGQLVDKVVQVSSCAAAEMAKFIESAFRYVNVGLVNEMAVFCSERGIDVWEVLEAAATKPFGFMPFYPGPGAGGNDIPHEASHRGAGEPENGTSPLRIVESARSVNTQMPRHVASQIERALTEKGKELNGASVLALGVTYKPDVGGTVESPALKVVDELIRRGARVRFHDPYVLEETLNGDVLARSQLTERSVESVDLVAILTPHRAYDLDWIARHAQLVFDVRNAFGPDRRPNVVPL